RVVGGSFLAGTSLVSASIFVASSLFFFLFPRIGFNVFASHARRGLSVGFNERGVELGQNGLIKDNDQVVMRVELTDGQPKSPLYFRGVAFDRYENGRWTPSQINRVELKHSGALAIVGAHHGVILDRARMHELQRAIGAALRQEIYLEPMD